MVSESQLKRGTILKDTINSNGITGQKQNFELWIILSASLNTFARHQNELESLNFSLPFPRCYFLWMIGEKVAKVPQLFLMIVQSEKYIFNFLELLSRLGLSMQANEKVIFLLLVGSSFFRNIFSFLIGKGIPKINKSSCVWRSCFLEFFIARKWN